MKPKLFNEMTAAEKRVAIAKDAAKQIKARKYVPTPHHYVWLNLGAMEVSQESIEGAKTCQVCAAGGLAASAMRLGNQFVFHGALMTSGEVSRVFAQWFRAGQAGLIEAAFMTNSLPQLADLDMTTVSQLRKAVSFGGRYGQAKPRALAIFRNIIKNGGTFKP